MDHEAKILFSFTSIEPREWLLLLLLGGMGLVGYFCLTRFIFLFLNFSGLNNFLCRSLQLIPPTTVAVLRALEIVLAYGVQAAVLDEVGF